MNVTLHSLLTALVVSGIFSLLLVLLSFQTTWIMKLGLWPLCVLLLLAGLRMWLPVEMPFARPVDLELEKGSAWLSRPLWGELSLGEGLAFLWLLGILLLLGRLFAGWKTHQKQMEAWEEAPEEVMQLFHRCIPRGERQCLHSQRHQSTIPQRVFHPHHRFASGSLAGRGPASHSSS